MSTFSLEECVLGRKRKEFEDVRVLRLNFLLVISRFLLFIFYTLVKFITLLFSKSEFNPEILCIIFVLLRLLLHFD